MPLVLMSKVTMRLMPSGEGPIRRNSKNPLGRARQSGMLSPNAKPYENGSTKLVVPHTSMVGLAGQCWKTQHNLLGS